MKVNSFSVSYFRNLKEFAFTPGPGPNIIYGNNAQGKTNVLEALWLFTGARSFRGASDRDYLPKEHPLATGPPGFEDFLPATTLSLDFFAGKRDQTAEIRYAPGQRSIELNGIPQTSYAAFSGVFCGVIFSPDHLSLVKDGPEGRRQMIDTSLVQAYPKYRKAMENYNRALRQRNQLLKDIPSNAQLRPMLELWDDHIINYGGYISVLRARYIQQLAQAATEVYQGISGGKEQLSLVYEPSVVEPIQSRELDDYRKAIRHSLEQNRSEDLRYGNTSTGPHRDDLLIEINGMSARDFASQGQQRSAILSIKLAECSILEEQTGESPVILLDDVMSELDSSRRSYLLNKLEGKQVFITCCDVSAFRELERGEIFHMEDGRLVHQPSPLPDTVHKLTSETKALPCGPPAAPSKAPQKKSSMELSVASSEEPSGHRQAQST